MQKFLADPEPEVLCIKGKWGTGKTHAWEDAVKQAISEKSIKKYAYVSLFGMNSSSDIMQSVFANTTDFSVIDGDRRLPNFLGGGNVADISKKLKEGFGFVAEHATVPHIAGLGGVARALLSNLVTNTIVCIDDFERKGTNVSVNEIMGAIAQLRDARDCKVVLILNEDTLDVNELAEFKRYSEKVINSSFQFDPAPAESAAIAFPNNDALSHDLREACIQLEITNIRVMQKIGRHARNLMELLKDVDPDITKNVIRSLVVITWAIITPKGEGAPSLKYISRDRFASLSGDHEENYAEDSKFDSLLERYGFSHFDEFDEIIAKDVRNGFFNDDDILSAANKYLKDAKIARAQAAIQAAWVPFHGSFDNNEKQVAKSLFRGLIENIKHVSPSNLSSAVSVLNNIGFEELGKELLDSFIESQDDDYNFDLSDDLLGSLVNDPDVLAAFDRKAAEVQKALPTPMEAASMLYKDLFLPEAELSLAKLSVDDFIVLFKETKGADQAVIVKGCLAFKKIMNASERQRHITENAQRALLQIGEESRLNAYRIVKYGLTVRPPQSQA